MDIFNLFKAEDPLDNAPYIFPYFFYPDKISLKWMGQKTTVKPITSEKLKMWTYGTFESSSNIFLGAINIWTYFKQISSTLFYCYVKPSSDKEKDKLFAIIDLFSTDNLLPIDDSVSKLAEMQEKNLPFLFNCISSKLYIPKTLNIGKNNFKFPEEYKVIDEILLFSTKEDLYFEKPKDNYWSDYVLIILSPKTDKIEIIALDWFNKSGDDFGYVWPVSISRSKSDDHLYGRGIRMQNFVLDPSGNKIIGDYKQF